MEASKLQKKLNGSILKGTKVRIETARAQKRPTPEEPEPERPKKERSKKRKRDEAIPAIEIGERSVKRGWTVPSSKTDKRGDKKDKKSKSKYRDGKECLFKTVVPPNKVDLTEGKRRKRKNEREEIVHEFSKTTKHASFLRGSKVDGRSKIASQFVEGKGWVDEDGHLIEEVTIKRKATVAEKDIASEDEVSQDDSVEGDTSEELEQPELQTKGEKDDVADTSEDESSEISSSEAEPSAENANGDAQDTQTSSSELSEEESESSSDSSDSSDSEPEPVEESVGPDVETPSQSSSSGARKPNSRPDSSSGLTIIIPPPSIRTTPASNSKAVHPLEALYKRPTSTPSSKGPSGVSKPDVPAFSFFGADNDGEQGEAGSYDQVPLTPFTQRDFEFRGQRSAAPTPDTAHPSRRFMWPVDKDDDEDDDDGDEVSETPSGKDKGKGLATGSKDEEEDGKEPESDFQKWFYEHRGETNRAWKKRRKAAAKEMRQRENRKKADRAV